MELEGLRVTRLPQPLDGVRVAEQMRVDSLMDAGAFGDLRDDLPGPLAVDLEKLLVYSDASVVCVTLEPMGQAIGAGNHAGLFCPCR